MWRCPLCEHTLDTTNTTWRCANNHAFDRAKAGYVNLLPVQFKKSLQPGDDKAMLQARRGFHQRGSYRHLMLRLADMLAESHPQPGISLYDAGCGEGAYLRSVTANLESQNKTVKAAGSDIAKLAVEMAARQDKSHQYVVASSHQLPVRDATLNAVMQIFAPGEAAEYARVLSTDGILLTVSPGPEHLYELKQQIYDSPAKHTLPDTHLPHFSLENHCQVTFPLTFEDASHVSELIAMTPFTWKLSAQQKEALCETLTTVTADFICQLWRKRPVGEA